MKRKIPSPTTVTVLLCWALIAAVLFYLGWNNRQVTLAGENEHWRATFAVKIPKDILRDDTEGRFILTWIGDKEEYKQYRSLEYYTKFTGCGEGGREETVPEGVSLDQRFASGGRTVSWAFWHNPRGTVTISLDGGPPEEIILTPR